MADVPPKKNDSGGYVFYVSLVSQADTKIFQANPTLAAGDVKIAKDDGAPANLGTLPAVDADFTKRVKVTLSQAETNADVLSIIFSDAAGVEWCDFQVEIRTVTRQIKDLAYPATSGRSMGVEPDGHVHADLKQWRGWVPAALQGTYVQSRVQVMDNNVITSGALAATGLDAIADALWDELLAGHVTAGTAGKILQALLTKAVFDLK